MARRIPIALLAGALALGGCGASGAQHNRDAHNKDKSTSVSESTGVSESELDACLKERARGEWEVVTGLGAKQAEGSADEPDEERESTTVNIMEHSPGVLSVEVLEDPFDFVEGESVHPRLRGQLHVVVAFYETAADARDSEASVELRTEALKYDENVQWLERGGNNALVEEDIVGCL